jgi:hypothetical protein
MLGGDVAGRDSVIAPGPGHSRKDRSLSVRLTNREIVVHSHAGDDWQQCKDYVRERLGWPAWQPGDGRDRRVALTRIEAFERAVIDAESEQCCERSADDWERIKRAQEIWDGGISPRGTSADKYFVTRKLVLPDDLAGNVLRFHPACPWRDENTDSTIYLPALIAAFRSIDDDTITAIQRVALTAAGTKIGRRMLGVVHRAAVKLDPLGDTLHTGEGVETCMAARQLGFAPVWALGSVGMIAQFPVIDGVTRLRVLGESGEASAKAIRIVGDHWHRAGRKVEIVMPNAGHSDLNDELMAKATA